MQPVRILGARAGQILPHILPEMYQNPCGVPMGRGCMVVAILMAWPKPLIKA